MLYNLIPRWKKHSRHSGQTNKKIKSEEKKQSATISCYVAAIHEEPRESGGARRGPEPAGAERSGGTGPGLPLWRTVVQRPAASVRDRPAPGGEGYGGEGYGLGGAAGWKLFAQAAHLLLRSAPTAF